MLSAGEIPRELDQGRIHLGVTGEDLIRERIPGWPDRIVLAAPLGFGQADLIVAVPAFWVDVETMADLDEVAEAFRARHGHGLRIATNYHPLTRASFLATGVADYRLAASHGAPRGVPQTRRRPDPRDRPRAGRAQRRHPRARTDTGRRTPRHRGEPAGGKSTNVR